MTYDTIDNDVTMAGGAEGALGRIDKYELLRELGEGGFGTVYLARDTVADVDVAVKGLPPEVKHNAVELESIRGNFALVKRLRHPNIVAVTDLHQAMSVSYSSKDVESKLRVFERDTMVVMDYAPGVTLAQWRRQFPGGKVPLDRAIAVVRQVASALDYAHAQKVLHRDVKPANVMVESADGGKLVARVLDFGLAAEIRSSMGRLSREIRDTSGTRPYMAPEQWKGERQGPATDQYALAAMFYELVVGEVPFASVFDCGDPAVMRIAVTTDAPAIPADLPKCVRKALSVALAKKPEERFSSCGEFAAALEGKAKIPHSGARTGGAGKVIAALALLAAIGVGGLVYRQNQVRRRADQAKQEAASAAAARAEAERKAEAARRAEQEAASAAAAKAEAERKAEAARRTEEARKLEDARRKLEEERRAVEAERERIEKERARNEQQHETELSDESLEEQEARRKEIAELAEIRVDIAIKEESIAETMGKIAAYRNEPDGFAAHIANADAQRKIADGVGRSPATSAEAKATLKALEDAERVIQREYNWLKTNKTARDEAKQLDAEIDRDIVPLLERFKAGDYARVAYGKGDRLRKDGNDALAKGDFPTAKAKLSEAKKQLAAAATEAQRFCIDTHLKTAKKWSAASKWLQCVEECDTILGWDAANAEAKRLKAEAEKHLVPTAKVIVKVNGSELKDGETVRIGSTEWKTPIVWGAKNITKGSRYGGEVAYEKNGRRYFGRLDDFTIDWPGPRTFTVALREYTGPKHGDVKTLTLPGSAKMEMIYVGPGTFTMGSPTSEEGHADDETQHRVTLTKGFWLGKYEVTQKQWLSVMGSNPSRFKGDDLPVETVSWNDCQEFVKKANDAARRQFGGAARLPTEAEWEYACRAGTSGAYAGTGRLDDMGWYWDYIGSKTHPVGQKRPNAWGFYDMHGNVYEWCSDRRGSYEGDTTNPIGSASGDSRVLRGGGWFGGARDCRSADRFGDNPGNRSYNYGFRLCCSAEPREAEEAAQRAEAERREREAKEVAERVRRAKWRQEGRQEGRQFTIDEPYGLKLTMKWCPAGTFTMGSPTTEEGRYDDERQHQVTLSRGFWLGETEVTQGQWKKLMDGETIVDLARKGLRDDTVYNIAGKQQTLREFWGMPREGDPMNRCGDQKDDVPVYNVSWNEAVEFCRRLTQRERAKGLIPDGYEYRLPTEAEWEYACRAGTTAALPNGRDIRILGANNAPALDDISWYAGNSSVEFDGRGWDTSGSPEKQYPGGRACARDVKGKQANRWGLYDMIGNVWEWCNDWYGDYPYGSVSDPTGSATGASRVARGGGWGGSARVCRCAHRGRGSPGFRDNSLGFRVALAPSH